MVIGQTEEEDGGKNGVRQAGRQAGCTTFFATRSVTQQVCMAERNGWRVGAKDGGTWVEILVLE